jgi:hypothetical protein
MAGNYSSPLARFVVGLISNDTTPSVLASNAAILQSAFSIPGEWHLPLGDFAHNPFTITASVKVIGTGAGDGYGPENTPAIAMNAFGVTANTSLRSVHTSGGFGITIIAVGCSFDSIKFVNDNVQDSASGLLVAGPDAVSANRADGLRVNNCGFRGGYTQLLCGNTVGYTVAFNTFLNPQGYCLTVDNFFVADEGDPAIIGNSFNSFYYQALAAVYFRQGGGLKFVGNKINRQPGVKNDGSTWFINGLLFTLIRQTGVLTVTGNSIENVLREAIKVDITNVNAYFTNFVITGNEFENTAKENTTPSFSFTGRSDKFLKGFHMADNIIAASNGIKLTNCAASTIGVNTHKTPRNGTSIVDLAERNPGVRVLPQSYDTSELAAGTVVKVFTNTGLTFAETIAQNRTMSYILEKSAYGVTKTVKDFFLIDMESYTTVKVKINVVASASTVGTTALNIERYIVRAAGDPVVVMMGQDSAINWVSGAPTAVTPAASVASPAVQDLQILFTVVSNTMKISLVIPSASGSSLLSNGHVVVSLEGALKGLTEYA